MKNLKKIAVFGTLNLSLLAATVGISALPAAAQVVAPAQGAQVDKEVARKQLLANKDVLIAEFLKLHNDARAEVGVPPLVYDATLATYAQEWADSLAAKGDNIEHRTGLKVGENLAAYSDTSLRPVHGAKMWYDEIKNYDAVKNAKIDPNGVEIGHYTQMVWRSTTKVGFGVAMSANGMIILAANYDPAGNMNGEHPYKK